ncbi:hypothetical protein EG829_26030 [bacterium]|nr:hypothetical protein [bacterium]
MHMKDDGPVSMPHPEHGAGERARYRIEATPGKCTGCLRCCLACSMLFAKTFNPSLARIHVRMKGTGCEISFTTDCTGCGACAEQCFYDALARTGKGEGE